MTDRRRFLQISLASLALSLPPVTARAGQNEVFATDGIAMNGYDPVAYFTEGRPVRGRKEFSLRWSGAVWRFASGENRYAFEMNPDAYAPQYGGFCAYAVAKGSIAPTVPEAWTIYEGRLYLNFSKAVRRTWRKDIPRYVAAADANWPGVLQH